MKRVCVTINGQKHEFVVNGNRVLLDVLREDLRLTGAKWAATEKGSAAPAR